MLVWQRRGPRESNYIILYVNTYTEELTIQRILGGCEVLNNTARHHQMQVSTGGIGEKEFRLNWKMAPTAQKIEETSSLGILN